MSFLLKTQDESILFSGDIILGTPSTVVEDLPTYIDTLKKLRDTPSFRFDKVCIPHSVTLDFDPNEPDPVILDGPQKLEAYIKYREDRLEQLIQLVKKLGSDLDFVSRDDLYEGLYGERNLEGKIKEMAYNNLDQQIDYFIKKEQIQKVDDQLYRYI